MTNDRIRLGIIGANVAYGWTPRAHAPAIAELPQVELTAVCTAHKETAREAAAKFGARLAFDNHKEMLATADLDAVAVVVRVPLHYGITMDVLSAGKNVYTEWPLGANVSEADEMASLAKKTGVHTMVGLQSRASPIFLTVRDLIADGYLGKVLSANLKQFSSGVLERPSGRTWQKDSELGATTLTISFGHSIDALCMCLGEFESISATVSTQVPQWHEIDTGQMVDVTSPDTIFINGTMASGTVVSAQVSSIPYHGSGYLLEIYGEERTLIVKSAGSPSLDEATILVGGKGADGLREITPDQKHRLVPLSMPIGPPFNIGQLWSRFANGIKLHQPVEPDFTDALIRHKLIEAIQQSSDSGMVQRL